MAEDLFDGAIGIDLGTTYSYVSKFTLRPVQYPNNFFFCLAAALEYGKMTVLKSLPMTVREFDSRK